MPFLDTGQSEGRGPRCLQPLRNFDLADTTILSAGAETRCACLQHIGYLLDSAAAAIRAQLGVFIFSNVAERKPLFHEMSSGLFLIQTKLTFSWPKEHKTASNVNVEQAC